MKIQENIRKQYNKHKRNETEKKVKKKKKQQTTKKQRKETIHNEHNINATQRNYMNNK